MFVLGGIINDHVNDVRPERCVAGNRWMAQLDLTSLQWVDSYITSDPEYQVPKAIVDWIGGRYLIPVYENITG